MQCKSDCVLSHNSGFLRLLMIRFRFRYQTTDAVLELAVLGGVYERVDAAVREHQHDGEVVEPAGKVDGVAGEIQKERDRVDGPAYDESAAYYQ